MNGYQRIEEWGIANDPVYYAVMDKDEAKFRSTYKKWE
jgi:hypothetical protein